LHIRSNPTMFGANLRNYVFQDNSTRLRDDRVSLLIAFAFSVLMLALGEPEYRAALEGLAVLGICMLSFTVYSCTNAAKIAAGRPLSYSGKYDLLYRPVSRRLALLSAIALAMLAALPKVAAAALDRKLRQLTARVPLNGASINEITQTINEATAFGIKPSGTTGTVLSALRETSKIDPSLSVEAIRAGSAVASASTVNIDLPREMRGKMFASLPESKGSIWSFSPIATNIGPDNYATIGLARLPYAARMERIENPIPEFTEYGPAFLVVKGLTAALDGFHLKHIVFQDMRLLYHGGPLILEDVYFFHCALQFDSSEEAWGLISAITTGGWVTLSIPSRASGGTN
jgi:hypothetical protein